MLSRGLISLLLALFVCSSQAHIYLNSLVIDGSELPRGDCLRPQRAFEPENPLPNVYVADMTCGWLPEAANPANRRCPVEAGSKIGLQWYHNHPGSDDNIIDPTHKGPCIVYMAKSNDGSGPVWFKIFEQGLGSDGKWCTDVLIENRGLLEVTIPSDIVAGDYLLRGEITALHNGYVIDGAQLYVSCAELTISGSGSSNPSSNGVAFPGYYQNTDSGFNINLYGPPITQYTIPGPALYVPGTASPTIDSSSSENIPSDSSSNEVVDSSSENIPSDSSSNEVVDSSSETVDSSSENIPTDSSSNEVVDSSSEATDSSSENIPTDSSSNEVTDSSSETTPIVSTSCGDLTLTQTARTSWSDGDGVVHYVYDVAISNNGEKVAENVILRISPASGSSLEQSWNLIHSGSDFVVSNPIQSNSVQREVGYISSSLADISFAECSTPVDSCRAGISFALINSWDNGGLIKISISNTGTKSISSLKLRMEGAIDYWNLETSTENLYSLPSWAVPILPNTVYTSAGFIFTGEQPTIAIIENVEC